MRVKMILPALTEAKGAYWRSIKYSLFPPLGLATLAGHLSDDDEVVIEDEHVAPLDLNDEPDLVILQVYITSARRAYEIADRYRSRGVRVAMGGIHVTACPREAIAHADHIFLGPGDSSFPRFLTDLRDGGAARVYRSGVRCLRGLPSPRRDLLKRHLYLVANTIVVSRGCPHHCDFCYKDSFYRGGKSYYTSAVDEVLAEIESLPGRHVFFLDDHLFGDRRLAQPLLDEVRGMGRVWQAAATVQAVLTPGLMEKAADAGLRSLFIGFESLSSDGLREQGKTHNVGRDYEHAIRRLHDLGVMINASFVFGMDADDSSVFDRTVDWAVRVGIETATFHVLTPYPGTSLYRRMESEGRLLHHNWDLFDTRHAVYKPAKMSPRQLEQGYLRAYRRFYGWPAILRAAATKPTLSGMLRHLTYTGGWKKFDGLWSWIIRSQRVGWAIPLLESVLSRRRPHSRRSPNRALHLTGPREQLVASSTQLVCPSRCRRFEYQLSREPSLLASSRH